MPCASQNKFNGLLHTISKSYEKWSMNHLCNSNTRHKVHSGISSVYYHYPNSLNSNEMNSRNLFVPHVFRCGHVALKSLSHSPQKTTQQWWMTSLLVSAGGDWSASEANDLIHTQCDRIEERHTWKSQRGAWQNIHHKTVTCKCGFLLSFLFLFPLVLFWFCAGLCNRMTMPFLTHLKMRFQLQETLKN